MTGFSEIHSLKCRTNIKCLKALPFDGYLFQLSIITVIVIMDIETRS